MESFLRLGALLVIVAAVIALSLWNRLRKRSDVKDEYYSKQAPEKKSSQDDLLMLSVMAKPNKRFESYDLLQAITATGMQYGAMNIFHYYLSVGRDKVALFSLASATEPGEINLDTIGEFSCTGLILFARLSETPDPEQTFQLMLQTAEQLTEDLDGVLKSDPKTPWDEVSFRRCHQKVKLATLTA